MKNKKILASTPVVLILLVIIVVSVLMLTGRIAILWKQPQQQAILITRVCNASIVEKYNKASQVQMRNGQYTDDQASLNKLADEIKAKENYKNDPTCQTILFQLAINAKDYQSAKEAYTAITSFHSKHIYPDSDLLTNGTLSTYNGLLQQISPANSSDSNNKPQGGG